MVHLEDKSGGVAGRWAQFCAVTEAISGSQGRAGATVIAGDFNTFDSRLARLAMLDRDADALGKPRAMREAEWWKTQLLPQDRLRRSISAIEMDVPDPGIGGFASSDHRPIWVDFDLADLGDAGSCQ